MVLDKKREGDQVVESDGVKILFLSSELAPTLEGMVIDYQETPQGGGFTISRFSPGT
jgi:Fe-S cluster assembly iron-binding protein IscA